MKRFKRVFAFCYFRLSRDLIGKILITFWRNKNKFHNDSLVLPSHICDLQKSGIAVIKSFISAEQCATLIQNFKDYSESNPEKVIVAEDVRLFNAQLHLPACLPIALSTELRRIGRLYLGTPIKLSGTLVNCVAPNTSTFGSGGSWHRDAIFPQFKALVYLSDVDHESDGAFTFVPGTHRTRNLIFETSRIRGRLSSTRWTQSQILEFYPRAPVSVTESAGTLILFDSSLLHRGSPNTNQNGKSRYAITNYYRSTRGKFEN